MRSFFLNYNLALQNNREKSIKLQANNRDCFQMRGFVKLKYIVLKKHYLHKFW